MKTKIKEREDGSRYHVWDAEQSTPAMVAFGVNWGITFFMIITGEMSPGLGVFSIAFTALVVLPLLIAVMNRLALRIPILPDYDRIAELEADTWPPCGKCGQRLEDDLDAVTHECPEPTLYDRWYALKPQPPEWGSATSAEVHAYNEAKLAWARLRPAQNPPKHIRDLGASALADKAEANARYAKSVEIWAASRPRPPLPGQSKEARKAFHRAQLEWAKSKPLRGDEGEPGSGLII
jgi:hypothetical protein